MSSWSALRRRMESLLRHRWRNRNESGTAAIFVVGITLVLLACAGLVLDGGNALNTRMRLADNIEQAARAGAQQINVGHLRAHGEVRLDQSAASDRAREFISSFGYTDVRVHIDADDSITISARDTVDTNLLSLIGIHRFDVSASATSEAVTQ